ncbi:hypothetical protein KEM54_000454 [Ascosphaera aggregata]|nr:hypothetical protein KEM54_000454 [Ascosphaera aggregata]
MEHSVAHSPDKKRNKLGYHRTSVACIPSTKANLLNLYLGGFKAHCRRRKIRCVPSGNSGRCENCIRLKKECRFHPVDQQPSNDRKGHAASKSEIGLLAKPAIVPSSPPHAGPIGHDEFIHYGPLAFDHGHDISATNGKENLVRSPLSPYHGTDTSSMPTLSGISSPMNHQTSWNNNSSFFDNAVKRETMGDPGWGHASSTSPSQTSAMPPPPIPEEEYQFDTTLSAHTQSPVWSPPGPPPIARAISYESVPLYANPLQQPLRRMTVPSASEIYHINPYNSPPSIPENHPAPTSPAAYGMEPLSLDHYANFSPFVEQPEVLSPPYTTTPPGVPADPTILQSEMSQTHWIDPNIQYGATTTYAQHSPPLQKF